MTPEEKKQQTLTRLKRLFENILNRDPGFYGEITVKFQGGNAIHADCSESVKLNDE